MYDEALITSEVCIRCGACCSVYVHPETNELLSLEEVDKDSVLVSCPNLISKGDTHVCSVYADRPSTCRDYHCLKRANERGLTLSEDSVIGSRIIKSITVTQ